MIWNEEFDGNTLNTTRWTVTDVTPPATPDFSKRYPRNLPNNVRVQNGVLILNTTYTYNSTPRTAEIIANYTGQNNVIYESRARFRDGVNANPEIWFFGGHGACEDFDNMRYQEIDLLEYFGNALDPPRMTSGGVHYCICTCQQPFPNNCTSQGQCREPNAQRPYSVIDPQSWNIFYSRWTTNKGIWTGQNYNQWTFRQTPSQMNNNNTNWFKHFVLSTGYRCWDNSKCNQDLLNFPYWLEVDYVRFYTLRRDCNTIVTQIPNWNTFNYAVKRSITLNGNTSVPINQTRWLYATDFIDLNEGFSVPQGTSLGLGIIDCN